MEQFEAEKQKMIQMLTEYNYRNLSHEELTKLTMTIRNIEQAKPQRSQ